MSSDPIRPLVLLVDDEPPVVAALSALLAPRLEPLFRVESAASAEEALEIVAAAPGSPVALVITDEKMPGQQGTDLLIALRQRPEHRDGGRIIVTGYAGLASAQKAINEAEVDRYYPKPWDAAGALLPAVGEILGRFAKKQMLDRFLVALPAVGVWERTLIGEARRAWSEYLSLLGEPGGIGDGEEALPEDPLDKDATLFLAYRAGQTGKSPAGTIRLRRDGHGTWILDGLAFQPEEAGDEVETLLLRTALLRAASENLLEVRTDAPALRRDVYEPLGFTAVAAKTEAAGTVPMTIRPKAAVDGWTAFTARFTAEGRLCSCAQTSCVERDYAAKIRGYWCPLDVLEGRTPEGFPVRVAR